MENRGGRFFATRDPQTWVAATCTERTMPVRIETITMDCRNERSLSAFWTAALGYDVAVDQPGDWMVPRDPSGTGPSIGLQVVPEPKVVKNRVHLNLIPTEGELET